MGPPPQVAAIRRAVRDALTDLAGPSERTAGAPDPDAAPGIESRPGTGSRPGRAVVLVACSGGADSLALAAAAAFVGPRLGLRVVGATVDHGLQPGSAQRAEHTAATLRELGLDPVRVLPVRVEGDGGPEAAARRARLAALARLAERLGALAVLLGHTRDDQAETVLLGLARGSGARSLAGMAPVSGLWRRPFLALGREQVRLAAQLCGLAAWEDPHNFDPRFTRSRVRHDALPALRAALGPGVGEALARTATLLRADADLLDELADQARARVVGSDGDLDVRELAGLPTALRTRVLRAQALAAGAPPARLSAAHVAALDALVTGWHGQGPLQLPGGVVAARRCGRIHLRRSSTSSSPDGAAGAGPALRGEPAGQSR